MTNFVQLKSWFYDLYTDNDNTVVSLELFDSDGTSSRVVFGAKDPLDSGDVSYSELKVNAKDLVAGLTAWHQNYPDSITAFIDLILPGCSKFPVLGALRPAHFSPTFIELHQLLNDGVGVTDDWSPATKLFFAQQYVFTEEFVDAFSTFCSKYDSDVQVHNNYRAIGLSYGDYILVSDGTVMASAQFTPEPEEDELAEV